MMREKNLAVLALAIVLPLGGSSCAGSSSEPGPGLPPVTPGLDTQPGPAPDGPGPRPLPDTGVVPQPDTGVVPQPDTSVVPQPDTGVAPQPDQGHAYTCGPNDSECPTNDYYLKSCTDGTCFGKDCCCPKARTCRAGSFPVCCEPGTTCKSTATGECG